MAKKKTTAKKSKTSVQKVIEKSVKTLNSLGAKIHAGSPTDKIDPQTLLDHIQEQSDECDSLAHEMVTAQEEHKSAKAAYDKAVEQLRRLCRKPDMPLYEDAAKEPSLS